VGTEERTRHNQKGDNFSEAVVAPSTVAPCMEENRSIVGYGRRWQNEQSSASSLVSLRELVGPHIPQVCGDSEKTAMVTGECPDIGNKATSGDVCAVLDQVLLQRE
jgi:hypothetical protein